MSHRLIRPLRLVREEYDSARAALALTLRLWSTAHAEPELIGATEKALRAAAINLLHAGLGTGTQLGMAAASALSLAAGLPELTPEELAERIGRGKRSGLGVHGFARGGFLVDGGKRGPGGVAPLVARVDFPEAWRVVLVLPPGQPGLHGEGEGRAFEQLREGGRIIAPIGAPQAQELQLVQKVNGQPVMTHLEGCRFVPLVGTKGFSRAR